MQGVSHGIAKTGTAVFAANIDAGTGLTVLKTPYGLDDIRWATTDGGMLYVVDDGPSSTGASALYQCPSRRTSRRPDAFGV